VSERKKPAFGDARIRIVAKAQEIRPVHRIVTHHDLEGIRGQTVRVLVNRGREKDSDGW
jgi:hypothetical protein